ncbi:hypothetical protein A2W24_03925 [Microgenomates group bacterium RBG_16_45_19]|nr:MAG: hypothetical protein A2W24_03925 [Microgenomates group bacterium RBG_16_45_19]
MKKLLIPVLTISLIAGGLSAGAKVMAEGWGNSQAERQAEYEAYLDEAVTAGKLTVDQEQLILQKHTELQAQREAERQVRQQQRQELEAWAEANGIETQYLFGMGGEGFGHGPGRGGIGMGRMGE